MSFDPPITPLRVAHVQYKMGIDTEAVTASPWLLFSSFWLAEQCLSATPTETDGKVFTHKLPELRIMLEKR